jgi:mannose-1-phosphate guanylyltransferase
MSSESAATPSLVPDRLGLATVFETEVLDHPWAIILAGGEGRRLRGLVRRLMGADLPKQYCALIGRRSMLQHTLDRVALLIPPDRILSVITRDHAMWARKHLPTAPPDLVVEQPANRDTAPGLLLPLLWIGLRDPTATVAVFPSDHFILEEAIFMDHVREAVSFLRDRPDLVLILGIAPDRPEAAYGWIEPGAELARRSGYGLLEVRRFWEKPDTSVAERLFLRGCFWNSLVLVGRLAVFLECFRQALPGLWACFETVRAALWTSREGQVLEEVYRRIPSMNLSRELLERIPYRLGLVPVKGVHWSDWGDEERIVETLARIGKEDELRARLKRARGGEGEEAA